MKSLNNRVAITGILALVILIVVAVLSELGVITSQPAISMDAISTIVCDGAGFLYNRADHPQVEIRQPGVEAYTITVDNFTCKGNGELWLRDTESQEWSIVQYGTESRWFQTTWPHRNPYTFSHEIDADSTCPGSVLDAKFPGTIRVWTDWMRNEPSLYASANVLTADYTRVIVLGPSVCNDEQRWMPLLLNVDRGNNKVLYFGWMSEEKLRETPLSVYPSDTNQPSPVGLAALSPFDSQWLDRVYFDTRLNLN